MKKILLILSFIFLSFSIHANEASEHSQKDLKYQEEVYKLIETYIDPLHKNHKILSEMLGPDSFEFKKIISELTTILDEKLWGYDKCGFMIKGNYSHSNDYGACFKDWDKLKSLAVNTKFKFNKNINYSLKMSLAPTVVYMFNTYEAGDSVVGGYKKDQLTFKYLRATDDTGYTFQLELLEEEPRGYKKSKDVVKKYKLYKTKNGKFIEDLGYLSGFGRGKYSIVPKEYTYEKRKEIPQEIIGYHVFGNQVVGSEKVIRYFYGKEIIGKINKLNKINGSCEYSESWDQKEPSKAECKNDQLVKVVEEPKATEQRQRDDNYPTLNISKTGFFAMVCYHHTYPNDSYYLIDSIDGKAIFAGYMGDYSKWGNVFQLNHRTDKIDSIEYRNLSFYNSSTPRAIKSLLVVNKNPLSLRELIPGFHVDGIFMPDTWWVRESCRNIDKNEATKIFNKLN